VSDHVSQARLSDIDTSDIIRVGQDLISSTIPLLFWAGYDVSRLVHSAFIADWTVGIPSSEPFQRVAPRYWTDIRGQLVPDAWRQSVNLVKSLVMHQPGVTEVKNRTLHLRLRVS
jgi:hypothetical protein